MTRPAHTPGPWRVEGPSKVMPNISDGGDYAVLDADGKIIAEAIRKVGVDNYRPAEANAHLIAAAPELLEAARDAEKLIEDMSRFVGQMSLKDYALFNEAPIKLAAAIAKAGGQS